MNASIETLSRGRIEASKQSRPNLFIVGAPKCGTTSMYEYLRQHPRIFFPFDADIDNYMRIKEPNHFCPELVIHESDVIHDRDAYLALYRDAGDAVWRGDASTFYLVSEQAPLRILRFSPQARILIMLRPPFDFMHSYHSELLRYHHEDISDFYEAIEASEDRRLGRRIPPGCGVPRNLDYFAMCRFAPYVERYYDIFGRSAVKIVLLEDLAKSPIQTLRDVFMFLGVEESFTPNLRVHNETPRNGPMEHALQTVYSRSGIKHVVQRVFPPAARHRFLAFIRSHEPGSAAPDPRDAELRRQLIPDVDRLAKLIGRDLDHWKTI
ncbi:MAG: sulfotransferase [Gammaproteobacteria bacterium]